MPAPRNPFKHGIAMGELQLGCWMGLAEVLSQTFWNMGLLVKL